METTAVAADTTPVDTDAVKIREIREAAERASLSLDVADLNALDLLLDACGAAAQVSEFRSANVGDGFFVDTHLTPRDGARGVDEVTVWSSYYRALSSCFRAARFRYAEAPRLTIESEFRKCGEIARGLALSAVWDHMPHCERCAARHASQENLHTAERNLVMALDVPSKIRARLDVDRASQAAADTPPCPRLAEGWALVGLCDGLGEAWLPVMSSLNEMDYSNADGYAKNAVDSDASCARAWLGMAANRVFNFEFTAKNCDEVQGLLQRCLECLERQPRDGPMPTWGLAEAHALSGHAFARVRRFNEAHAAYAQAIQAAPGYAWVTKRLLPQLEEAEARAAKRRK